jgi:hypothetical protein
MKECNCDWAQHWQKLAMRTMELNTELFRAKALLKHAWYLMEPDSPFGVEIKTFLKLDDDE